MKSTTALILTFFGLILAMLGMGGVEHSMNDADLLLSTGVCILGLLSMFAGTQAMNVSYYYDKD